MAIAINDLDIQLKSKQEENDQLREVNKMLESKIIDLMQVIETLQKEKNDKDVKILNLQSDIFLAKVKSNERSSTGMYI